MDTLVEDDICILNHEKAHRRDTVTPISIYSGDESVASHFALVTAYEDIKKRLKDSEKENSFLKKRIRFLEEKVIIIFIIFYDLKNNLNIFLSCLPWLYTKLPRITHSWSQNPVLLILCFIGHVHGEYL